MDNPKNIKNRIKRHVQGKIKSFYLSTPPAMERLCFDELASLEIPMTDVRLSTGGIAFNARVHDCYRANLHLRMANRILMRVATFRATNFRQMGKKLKDFPWELYLYHGVKYNIRVTSRHSRLFHTDAIGDQFKESVENRLGAANHHLRANQTPYYPQQIFIRGLKDRFTVSIDSSGELLHRRGLKTQGGVAPIRETTASAILTIAGYRGSEPLMDPMCGTGTFSLEGALIATNIPAGWHRNFAFMSWPCFKSSRWRHIRRKAEQSITRMNQPSIFASDKDQVACNAFRKVIHDHQLSSTVSISTIDFFDLFPLHINGYKKSEQTGLVIINPPYGRRLKSTRSSEKLFGDICEKLKRDFKGWKIALVSPDKKLAKKVPFSVTEQTFFHGGLLPTLLTGRIT